MNRLSSKAYLVYSVDDCGLSTFSSQEQENVEESCKALYAVKGEMAKINPKCLDLDRKKHIAYLKKGLRNLSSGYTSLEASQPWLLYWSLQGLALLDEGPDPDHVPAIIQHLKLCQSPEGGFAGGPGQYAHLAPTYAAVNTICLLNTPEAYKIIDRPALQQFLWRMRQADGSFTMHDGGEVDTRAAYCALTAAKLTNVYVAELFDGTAEWLARCQSYEGGYSATPGAEAHGGYSFCALAALLLLGRHHLVDVASLARWLASRQMILEGGFQGRTNKLVDGCYSFWQGGAVPLLHMAATLQNDRALSPETWMFCRESLQQYVHALCQFKSGGLIDKPGKRPDYYHTCYCLSGLSVAQHYDFEGTHTRHVLGHPDNELKLTHPIYNVVREPLHHALQYFNSLDVPM